MSLLLDTHVLLWSQLEPARLGKRATRALVDPAESLTVATISSLEIARLVWGERLQLDMEVEHWLGAALGQLGATTLELSHEIAVEAYRLPGGFHPDPADRILVATARIHGLTLVTADRRILEYSHVGSLDAAR